MAVPVENIPEGAGADPLAIMREAAMGRSGGRSTSMIQGTPGGTGTVIGMSPGDPGFASRIPPPETPGIGATFEVDPVTKTLKAVEIEKPVAAVTQTSPRGGSPGPSVPGAPLPAQRIVVSFGPRSGILVVGVEEAPDWDLDFSIQVDEDSVIQLLPILRKLARVKDLTGGLLPPPPVPVKTLEELLTDEYSGPEDPEAAPPGITSDGQKPPKSPARGRPRGRS